jgi:hypothetical protein
MKMENMSRVFIISHGKWKIPVVFLQIPKEKWKISVVFLQIPKGNGKYQSCFCQFPGKKENTNRDLLKTQGKMKNQFFIQTA